MMHHHGKLRNKIFVVIALVSIVPLLLAGIISYFSLNASHRGDVANLEDTLLDQKLGEVKNAYTVITNYLRPRLIQGTGEKSHSTSQDVLGSLMASGGSVGLTELHLIGLDGKELAAVAADRSESVPTSSLQDMSGAPWFSVVKSGKTYVGPIDFSGAAPSILIAAPAADQQGADVFILKGTFMLTVVQAAIRNTVLGDSGYLYLVDHGGKVIASTVSGPAETADMGDVGIVKQLLNGQDFSGTGGQSRYKNFLGEPVVAAGKYFTQAGWALIVEWPAQEADREVDGIIWNNIWIMCAAIVAVIVVSIVLAALIVRPVRRLEDGTARVSEGKFDAEVSIKTGDELEDLGAAFNQMIVGLRRLEELKNEFVFVAAHELRTPVAAMKGYLTLILEGIAGPITDKTRDFMEKVVQSNDRLGHLVNDLLEISRSEGGKLTIKVVPIDVVPPIQGVLAELASLAEKSSVKMVYSPPVSAAPSAGKQTALPQVMADSDRLREVMVNLIGNAIKYMGGAGTVTVSHEVKGRELVTHIADTGLGIAKGAQAKLFEKFYRVATEKTKNIQGTGLGLFIVKEILEKMNGKIWVESEEGKGSVFSFSLPLA